MADHPPIQIELRHLRYFLAVVEELHFGHAAERLHISQPPLSQAVRKLEEELGVQLLQRTSRVVTPTKAGLVFADAARDVLSCFELAVAEAKRAGGAGSTLRIGCSPYLSLARAQRFVNLVREQVPSVEPEIMHLLPAEQVKRLLARDLDIGIFGYSGTIAGIETAPIGVAEPLAVYFPADHPLALKRVLGPDDLADQTLVLLPRSVDPALYDLLPALLGQAGYQFQAIRETQGTDARDILVAVMAGLGVGLAPSSFSTVGEAGSVLAWRPLDPPVMTLNPVLAWRPSPPAELAAIIETIRDFGSTLREPDEAGRE